MGDDILKSFIESVDGERDPQVLVLNFKSFVELSKLLPNAEISEDTFEVIQKMHINLIYNGKYLFLF